MKGIGYLNVVLTVLTIVAALHLWTGWISGGGGAAAYAQGIPDAGAQRAQIIDQLKLLNQKADQLNKLLVSGKVRVVLVEPAQRPDAPGGRE